MSDFLLALTASLPVTLLFLLMVVFRKPAVFAAPVTFLATIFITLFIWGMPLAWIGASLVKSFFVTFEIVLIVFGAILFLNVLRSAGSFQKIETFLSSISKDRRVQAIIIGWFFVSFVEGVAGFGTPAVLAAPLLASIGFPPLAAVIVSLLGDSTAVTFGAVGVPITIGIVEGVGGIIPNIGLLIKVIIAKTALIHMFVGALIPLMISVSLTFFFGSKSLKRGLEIWPYAVFSGFCFTIPYFLVAVFLGPEFPSVLGALIGGAIVVFFTKKKIFTPKKVWDFPKKWKDDWGKSLKEDSQKISEISLLNSILPYFFVLGLLLITRLNILGIGKYLQETALSFLNIFSTTVSHSLSIFYSPGFLFIATALFFGFYFRIGRRDRKKTFCDTLKKIKNPAIALIFIIGIVQVLIFSGNNINNLPSIPVFIANIMAGVNTFWVFIAPLVGALGSFIAGSATVSNLLFSSVQAETALAIGMSPVLVLSLQGVGSAVGNMIAIHNVIAVLATVGILKGEGTVIRKNLIPVLIYVLLAGVFGFLLFSFGCF